ncbi:MAG TPA: site-specific integrase [Candidatus Acidoferrales bacterium]|nr:site-specific integrase [Candidatus Acidoferrales bacterium]
MPRKPNIKLYLRFRTPDGKQSPYCPAVCDSKSRLRDFWCLVNGQPEFHPNGYYYQRVKRDGKEKWESLGTDPHTASCKAKAQAKQEAHGTEDVLGLKTSQPEQPAAAEKAPGYRVTDEVREYLINAAKLAAKTYKAYAKSLELFQESCKKTYMHQIGKQDLQALDTFLVQRGNDDRTRSNRVGHIVTFLRNEQGRRPGPPITDVTITIKYVESPPEAYTRELEDLFQVSDEDERFLWRFFLGTGFRESETAVAESTDVNHDTKMIRVDQKPEFGFKPKDCEKRWVPIPDALIAEIDARAKSGSCSLLFDNNGRPDGHILRRLKRVAFDGGLNCGKCKGTSDGKVVSCGDGPVCEKWILHRFRKNFATDRHNAGASARKIQKWLGHADLETTLRYLALGDDTTDEVREIVNGVHIGL